MKVSVVVPTYAPGAGLDRVMGSLDAQTLPGAEFEAIFVDDGSPDDTFARLTELARDRAWMRIRRIENSGWPSRPRNVGLELARGEYVLFMDHDDALYPDALERGYAYAVEQRADVLSAKETRTSHWFAYEGVFGVDIGGDVAKQPGRFGPWTTHKLFRTAFLRQHGIHFREGTRVLFEDVLFDISAFAHAERIAVLASVPFYQWVHSPGQNYSSGFDRDHDEYLRSIVAVLDHAEVAGTRFADWMRAYQYELRILGQLLGPSLLRRNDEDRRDLVAGISSFIRARMPESMDTGVNPVLAARARLARDGDEAGLATLARVDRPVRATADAITVEWDALSGDLALEVAVSWWQGPDEPLRLLQRGDRVLRTFPDGELAGLPAILGDVTEATLAAAARLTVTSRQGKVGWPVDSESRTELAPLAGDPSALTLRTTVRARLCVVGDELGRPLHDGVWDVACRASALGYGAHVAVAFEGVPRILANGSSVATAHANPHGRLSVRLGAGGPALARLATFSGPEARASRLRGGLVVLDIPLSGLEVAGTARLPVAVVLQPVDGRGETSSHHAVIELAEGRARLRGTVDLPARVTRLAVRRRRRDATAVPIGLEVARRAFGRLALRSARRSGVPHEPGRQLSKGANDTSDCD